MSKHLKLNIISNISESSHNNQLIEHIASIMTNPLYIRLGSTESIRSKELAEYLSVLTKTQITHTRKLPEIMINIMAKYPEFNIVKKIKTCGTVYLGLTIASSPPAKIRNPPLNNQQKNERRRIRNLEIFKTIKHQICAECGWTDQHYQQMCNLGVLQVIRDENTINISCMITVAKGNLVKYIYDKISSLKQERRAALIVKEDFEKAQRNDAIQSINSNAAIYTNRLNSAKMTYYAGDKLDRAINSYINTLGNLPIVENIIYPDIQQVIGLAVWLKNNSMFKTAKDMAEKQELFSEQTQELNVAEEDLYAYSEAGTIITKVC